MKFISKLSTQHRFLFAATYSIFDVIILIASHLVIFSVRLIPSPIETAISFYYILLFTGITIASFYVHGIYRRIWSQTSGLDIVLIIRATLIAFVIALISDLIVSPRPVPISVLIVAYALSLAGFVVIRYRSRLLVGLGWRWRAIWFHEFPAMDLERVLIIGAGESGQATALRLRHRIGDKQHYKVIGFLDDELVKQGMFIEGSKVLGTIEEVGKIVEINRVDLIVVAIHNIDGPTFRRILTLCEHTNARIKVVPDMFKLFENRMGSHPLRDVRPEDLIGRSIVTKHKDIDLSPLTNKIVLVTGAAGSIGSELAQQIIEYSPTKLILLDNNESSLHDLHITLKSQCPQLNVVPELVDVCQYNSLQRVYQTHQPQLVFHAAAYKHVPMLESYPNEAVRVNIGGTMNAVELAILNNVERFVLVSTDKAVDPNSVMGASKRICELVVHATAQSHMPRTLFATVRFGNVLGSRGSVVPTFNLQIENGGPVTVTHPDMTRYFMSISEATNLVIHAAAMTNGDDVFVLRMGEVVKIVDLAERMIRLRGLRPYTDIPIEFTGIRPGEKLHEQLFHKSEDPQNTKHPYIYRVASSRLNGHSTEFMSNIYHLVSEGIQDHNQALNELRTLADLVDSNVGDKMHEQ